MIRPAIAAATILLTGCATTERVVLLENEPGHSLGAIAVIETEGIETVLDTANTQARLSASGARVSALDRPDPSFDPLMASLPVSVTRFEIPFPVGDADILAVQQSIIERINAEVERRPPGVQIEVAGFTDSTGDEESNNVLSIERARAVAGELRAAGIAVEDGDVIGRGEYDARAARGDNVSDETYRRVVVIIR